MTTDMIILEHIENGLITQDTEKICAQILLKSSLQDESLDETEGQNAMYYNVMVKALNLLFFSKLKLPIKKFFIF